MSAKRPRPAIPVLVHVDNPAEVGSVTVDTSTIESKMNTVINNQNRIYDKIPTSTGGGGGSADLTTVNAKITALAETIGSADSKYTDDNLIGKIKNIALSTGEYGGVLTETATGLRSLLYNVRQSVGDCTKAPSATGTTVRDLLAAIKRNTESGDDLTTVNDKITAINAAVGDGAVLANDQSLIGLAKGIKASLGSMDASDAKSSSNIKGRLFNIQSSIGDALNSPSTTGSTVRDLLFTLKGSIGPANSTDADNNLLGSVKNLIGSIGNSNSNLSLNDTNIRSILYNLRTAIGSGSATPTLTGTSVRDLLTQIKENTASGGSGGSADLTTVNEKTTALAAAIGSASDDSSTVSVIGLLKSITDKY